MFGVTHSTTLAVIEAQIKQLEFNYMVVGSSQNLLVELGNAYKVLMMLINELKNGNIHQKTSLSTKNYPSKLNKKADPFENASPNGSRPQNLDVPKLLRHNIQTKLVPSIA